jgi:dihydrofolate reductase
MRKLKLQMQLSVDGFVAGPNDELDWMTWEWDDKLKSYTNDLHKPVDTILLGRKMTPGFISHWSAVVTNPEDESYAFAKKMVNTSKVVFTKTLDKSEWKNTVLATGDLADEIKKLKSQNGNDIIVYGGANFVSSLLKQNLIDELHFFINPVAIGKGKRIFTDRTNLGLVKTNTFECGITVLQYEPSKK